MKNKLLVVGPVTKDVIKTPTDTYTQIGGAAYYNMWTLHQLKHEANAIITLGKNDLEMANEFPDKKNVKIIKAEATMEYTNTYNEKTERMQKAILPQNPIKPEDMEKTNLNPNKYNMALLCPLSKNDIPPETMGYLKKNNMTTVLLAQGYVRQTDENKNVISSIWKNKESYLNNTDIISLNYDEAKIIFNLKKITNDKIQKMISKYNLNTIILTNGELGSNIYTKNSTIHIPAIKTEKEIDYTGLGDTYTATYIAGLCENKSIYESGLYASIAAKYKLENKGHLKTSCDTIKNELERRLNQIS